jgi:uncharacterized cupin superfamily protein
MPDQTVIVFDRDGDPETGLQDWEPIPAETLVSGSPHQRGHTCFTTAADQWTSGVWDCTAYTSRLEPYPVNEFMVLLEGSLELVGEDGSVQTFRAGDGFVIPKGAMLQWRQPEYVRKFWVIHDDANSPPAATGLTALLTDPDAELPRMPRADAALFESEVPDMGMNILYQDPGGKFIAGVWESTPMTRVASTIDRSELMHIIAGSGSIANADGVVFNFKAGDTFLVPVGMGYQWRSDEYVKKLFCSYTP